jgi:phosphoglycolate phosphatase-like HAD superfamily hydrolase
MKTKMIDFIYKLKIDDVRYTINQTTNEIINDLNQKMITQGISELDREKIFINISDILTEVEFENVHLVKLLDGVLEFLDFCKNKNIKISILTRASKKYTEQCLEVTGIREYFHSVSTRDDFTLLRAKPHIDALNLVINDLKIDKKNILFIGDHPIDEMCARKGEIRFVGIIPNGNDPYKLKELSCWKIISDYKELIDLIVNINN